MAYEVKNPFRDQTGDPATGQEVVCEFEAGEHSPKNEFEEAALERAVGRGDAVHVKKPKES